MSFVKIGAVTCVLRDINEFLSVLHIFPVWVKFSIRDLHIMPLIVCKFVTTSKLYVYLENKWNNMHVCVYTMKTDLCTLSQGTTVGVFVSFMYFKRREIQDLLECKARSFP